ncbi:hypothetical protein ThidrDRAFT_4198 [Thiorhodococcus drewsii AZ1]|uniref:Uncharacterized protein n=1 Tax=Thiorhodococcus drewsii AZ1 TaxID=765913 RepID=G2E7D5_9GAMM|nr:hypothetical protein ThidrDRAFT_4198 [Thiorhodococcus drewsii AZ1]
MIGIAASIQFLASSLQPPASSQRVLCGRESGRFASVGSLRGGKSVFHDSWQLEAGSWKLPHYSWPLEAGGWRLQK